MRLYNKLYQNIFFRSLDLLRGRQTIQRLKFLRRSQYWDRRLLEAWQLKRLNSLLSTAKCNSPFHSRRLQSVKLPLKNLKQLQDLPILSKRDMREHFEEIRCTNIPLGKCELGKTGGSTGEPSYYYLSNECKDWNRGTVYRSGEWAGVYLGDRTVQMMGSHYDFVEFQKIKWKVIFFLQRYRDLSVANVSEDLLDKYYHKIMHFKPSSIWGYASGIYLFSKFVEKNYPESQFDFIKAIITSSETLQGDQRSKINEVFGGEKVYDHYGSREAYLASECGAHNGYHIHGEVILLEVVDNNGDHVKSGDLGRILITDLSNRAFPFIRYEIGDVGVLSQRTSCRCGVTLPILEHIEGRIADMIVLRDRVLTPPNFTILMSDLQGIDAYQILQSTVDHLTIRIVRNNNYTEEAEAYIIEALRKLVGPNLHINIDYVKQIPVPLSGKRRFVISRVAHDLL